MTRRSNNRSKARASKSVNTRPHKAESKAGPGLVALVAGCIVLSTFQSGELTRNLTGMVSGSMKLNGRDYLDREQSFFVYTGYQPAPVEAYIMNHTQEMGLNTPVPDLAKTCHIWNDETSTPYYAQLQDYMQELEDYYTLVENFTLGIPDLRRNLTHSSHKEVCEQVKLHPDGLPGLFSKSQQLSMSASGWVEPLLPSMRHPKFCKQGRPYLLSMDYMVHDFETMCHKLKPSSRTVFVDMGASLVFHRGQKSPTLFMLDLFAKFGIKFDHVYAYEMTQQNPNHVFELIPEKYESAFHWINVGVASETDNRRNPFKLLLENYEEDDLVIVKLDVDTPHLETALANQLLNEPRLAKLIDHFYFEHHVNQAELIPNWGKSGLSATVADSMNLFSQMRQNGIPAHYWV